MRKIVCFEGFDGVGKTSLAKATAKKLGFDYRKSPYGVFGNARQCFDDSLTDKISKASFYIGDCMATSVQMSLETEKSYVLDRYYYSTLAYHFFSPNSIPCEFKASVQSFIKPDIVFLVTASYEKILSRLNERDGDAIDRYCLTKGDFDRIYSNLDSLICSNMVEIDNSGSFEHSLDAIVTEIGK